jgi:hypothetical protein
MFITSKINLGLFFMHLSHNTDIKIRVYLGTGRRRTTIVQYRYPSAQVHIAHDIVHDGAFTSISASSMARYRITEASMDQLLLYGKTCEMHSLTHFAFANLPIILTDQETL